MNSIVALRRTQPQPGQRDGWEFVSAAFQSRLPHCDECGYCQPYEGAPGERLVECTLGSRLNHLPTDCPALAERMEDLSTSAE